VRISSVVAPLALALACAGCAAGGGLPSTREPVAFVQSHGGSDRGDGSATHPFRSIQQCASAAKPGQTCAIAAGFYRETVIPNDGVTIRPAGSAPVWILTTNRVMHWKRTTGSIYAAHVVINASLPANQVFIIAAGVPQVLSQAQWPAPSGDGLHPNWATAAAGTTETTVVDPKLPNANLAGAVVNMWGGTDPWTHVVGPIVSSAAGQFTFKQEGDLCPYFCSTPRGFYYVTGGLSLLRAPGEWAYDAPSATLYLWAPHGADPDSLDVEVKQRSVTADLSNRHNVTIQGLFTAGGGIAMDGRSRNNTLDGITALYVSQVLRAGSSGNPYFTFPAYPHDSGILLDGSGNTFENGTIAYSATNGVLLSGTHNTVSNTLIHDVDFLGDYSAGIVPLTSGNSIEHDTIYNTGRAAITDAGYATSVAVDIGFNNLFNGMLVSADAGEMYLQGRMLRTSYRIHDNWVHEENRSPRIVPPSNTCGCPWGGVYIDSGGSGAAIDHNIIWHSYPGIYLHGGVRGWASKNDRVDYNTLPDKKNPSIWVNALYGFAGTELSNNRIATPIDLDGSSKNVPQTNNGPNAPGAGSIARPGCSFAGCGSSPPPL
jgi:Right handed beta helix region